MADRRIVIYLSKADVVVVEYQHLSKRPPGNAAQRAKALRSGWHPEWISSARPRAFSPSDLAPFQQEQFTREEYQKLNEEMFPGDL